MDRRWLHHVLGVLKRLRLWQLVLLFVMMVFVSVNLLRQNNLGMIQRRNALQMADEQGGDVASALAELHRYVGSHMNTSLGDRGIYLEHTYQQAYDRAVQATIQSNSPSAQAYQQADHECQSVFSRTASFSAYVQCVTDKVSALGGGQDPLAAVKAPPVDLFRINYVSPTWSPDAAGISILVTGLLLLLIIVRVFLVWLLRYLVRHRSSAGFVLGREQ